MKLDRATLINELGIRNNKSIDKSEFIRLIFDYFGDEDGELVLQIALFFKRPNQYAWVGREVLKRLEEEMV